MVTTAMGVSHVLNLELVCPEELQVSGAGAPISYVFNFTP